MSYPNFDRSGTAWISKGFEKLVATEPELFDVLIIGSGYGGAIAADTLSQHRNQNGDLLKICVLERGKEYLPGSFPANSTELAAHVRFGRNKLGLFDFRVGHDVAALIANGLGGGSLINAGVMKRITRCVLTQRWPEELSELEELEPYYRRVEFLLGSKYYGPNKTAISNEIKNDSNNRPLKKLDALRALANGAKCSPAPITVADSDRINSGYVQLSGCIRCGDCATGCNHNAKDSLDTNLLYRAYRRGTAIFSGATVLWLERNENLDGWLVHTVFTDSKLRALHSYPTVLKARNVILSAGTLGSTEILKRSAAKGLRCSPMLGRHCSTNGDTLIAHFAANREANAVGKESDAPKERDVGPTISGVIDLREASDPDLRGLLIEEMASPASMRRVFGEIYATVNTLHRLGDRDRTRHERGPGHDDIYELKESQIDHSALYAVMGDDGAEGQIELQADEDLQTDGTARIHWPGIAHISLFDRQVAAFKKLAKGTGGHVIPNPMWELLPKEFALPTVVPRGPVVTVHPLGGCAMADTSTEGVVDHLGRVFSGVDTRATYAGLAVLDGSIIPTALGVNPALTISAVALRAALELGKKWGYALEDDAWRRAVPAGEWNLTLDEENSAWLSKERHSLTPATRPYFRKITAGFDPDPTMMRITERMSGPVTLRDDSGAVKDWIVELTLRFQDKNLRQLAQPSLDKNNAVLHIRTSTKDPVVKSMLRIFEPGDFETAMQYPRPARELEEWLNQKSAFRSSVEEGTLTIFERQETQPIWRILRSGWAWLRNDGFRDLYQAIAKAVSGGNGDANLLQLYRGFVALASRAGERRILKYDLTLTEPVPASICGRGNADRHVTGEKLFTYGHCSNPWNQLTEMALTRFPGLPSGRHRRTLTLDLPFFARIRVPLLEITRQSDGVTAMAELGSFLAYIGRLILGIHSWNFRAPDAARSARLPERLPGEIPGLPHPEIHTLFMGKEKPYWSHLPDYHADAAVPTYVRLTRYANGASEKAPLVMLHGYSASGTTFAHPAVKDNFATWFHGKQRDIWIVDFRTSCGMPTARQPWSFEQVAYKDIPEAIEYICGVTGRSQVDVIAHCMGAAMFSMAILQLQNLRLRIRRVAFSQVSPVMVLSPINIFRGYVAQYFREMLPDRYEFKPGPEDTPEDRLIDRLLSSLPYSKVEYRREHPLLPYKQTPWTRTRHRMDALYGRAFNSPNLDDEVLRHIDDFFGPLSIDTVTQTINFARYNLITDVNGRNMFVSRDSLATRWGRIPLLTVSARDNGLADYRTLYRTGEIFRDAGRSVRCELIENAGHQDCLIGNRPKLETLAEIDAFLSADDSALEPVRPPQDTFVAYTPWIGPLVTREPSDTVSFRVGSCPTHLMAEGVMMLRVSISGGDVMKADGNPFTGSDSDRRHILKTAYFLTSDELRTHHWGKFPLPLHDAGDAWLVLMIYNDSEMLRETNSGAYRQMSAPFSNSNVRYFKKLAPGAWTFPVPRQSEPKSKSAAVAPPISELIRKGDVLPVELTNAMVESVVKLLSRQRVSKPLTGGPGTNRVAPKTSGSDPALRSSSPGELSRDSSQFEPSLAPAEAVLDRLVDENFDLRDGLIPDLRPAADDTCEFFLTSCQYPGGFLDGSIAYTAYRKTQNRMEARDSARPPMIVPRFGIFAGDQIYADASAGLFDPSAKTGRFELPYHAWLRFPHVRSVLRQVPSFMLPDDHEIVDNWEPIPGNRTNMELMTAGRTGFVKYQRGNDESLNISFKADDFPFWMADTRTGRDSRRATTLQSVHLLSQETIASIGDWIDRQPLEQPKFIVTPAMLLPRHRQAGQWDAPESCLNSDGWDGYPASLFRMLQLIADIRSRHIIFLSGDEHIPCFARIVVTKLSDNRSVVAHSIHTAAAYAPFPFANGTAASQIPSETIYFKLSADDIKFTSDRMTNASIVPGNYDYKCSVETLYPAAGDSMTYIRVRKAGDTWMMRCEFAADSITVPNLETATPIMARQDSA